MLKLIEKQYITDEPHKLQKGGLVRKIGPEQRYAIDWLNSRKSILDDNTKELNPNASGQVDSKRQIKNMISVLQFDDPFDYVENKNKAYVNSVVADPGERRTFYRDVNDMSKTSPKVQKMLTELGGEYSTKTHSLWINSNLSKDQQSNSRLHELTHSMNAKPQYNKISTFIPQKDKYYDDPSEVYSRLMEFRRENKLQPTKQYTIDEVKKMRSSQHDLFNSTKDFDLLERYDDNQMLKLINQVASIKKPTAQYIVDNPPKYQLGGLMSKLNPKNWGVTDLSSESNFNTAYKKAKLGGNEEFMWKDKRYSTSYAGTPRQEVLRYGVNGKKVNPQSLDNPIRVDKFNMVTSRYLPGHIEATRTQDPEEMFGSDTAIDYGPGGNRGGSYGPSNGSDTYNVYNTDINKFKTKAKSLEGKNDWNLLINNCADNVCDGLGLSRSKLLTTPFGAMNRIKKEYPTLNIKGRTQFDYLSKLGKMRGDITKGEYDNVLKNAKQRIYEFNSDEFTMDDRTEVAYNIQTALSNKGYDIDIDGTIGPKTMDALDKYSKGIPYSKPTLQVSKKLTKLTKPLKTEK